MGDQEGGGKADTHRVYQINLRTHFPVEMAHKTVIFDEPVLGGDNGPTCFSIQY